MITFSVTIEKQRLGNVGRWETEQNLGPVTDQDLSQEIHGSLGMPWERVQGAEWPEQNLTFHVERQNVSVIWTVLGFLAVRACLNSEMVNSRAVARYLFFPGTFHIKISATQEREKLRKNGTRSNKLASSQFSLSLSLYVNFSIFCVKKLRLISCSARETKRTYFFAAGKPFTSLRETAIFDRCKQFDGNCSFKLLDVKLYSLKPTDTQLCLFEIFLTQSRWLLLLRIATRKNI